MNRISLPFVALLSVTLAASAMAAGCAFEHKTSMLGPSSSGAASGGGSPSTAAAMSLVGFWESNALTTMPSPSSCGNFKYEISNQTESSIAGSFTALCAGGLAVAGNVTGQINGTSVPLTATGTATPPGGPSCNFTLTGTGAVEDNGRTLRIPYSGTTCLGPVSGTEVLRKPTPQAPPPAPAPPPPAPAPAPAPAPEPLSNDAIDLRAAIITRGPSNIASWTVGATITQVSQGNDQLCIWHDRLGAWPSVVFFGDPATLVEGNQWVFAFINGRWYGGAADWYRPGQACKNVTAESIARDAFYGDNEEPLRSWVPRPGELFAVMSTTPARAWPAMATLDQRTNVVTLRWK